MTTLYLGGYTTDQPPATSGLARVSWTHDGFGEVERLDGPGDPSWLVRVSDAELYAVGEGDPGRVTRVRPGEGVVAEASAGGQGTAHLALSPDGRWLVASNYVAGSVALVAVGADGSLEQVDELGFEGRGPHERQDAPHAHQAVFLDDGRLLVCDLGTDEVHEVSVGDGRLRHTGDIDLPRGSGPRHLALAPGRDDLLWVVGELDQTVHTVRRADGGWTVTGTVSTTPEGPGPGETTAAGIVVSPDGSHVYVSTRGTDTVSVLAAGEDGTLTLRQQVVTGHWPRFIGWIPGEEGSHLLVAAEKEGSVDVWAVDEGLLEETGHSLAWSAPTWVG
ncbi:lactonase family protein [Ornithinimicrobium cerasi]|uniref:lactonase family protein n=1 Tax=Ornithinimicrobium cerasi TaxID=2248773 RepID=UPI000EFF17AB|nr:beta-propeller fold lactonase family protein [Ornithinimicrobium cerasi]